MLSRASGRKTGFHFSWTPQSHFGLPENAQSTTRPSRMRQRGDLGHLLLAQHEIKDGGVLGQPLDLAGARNDDDVLLHQIAQADLRRGLAVRGADARQHGVVARLPRAIGL